MLCGYFVYDCDLTVKFCLVIIKISGCYLFVLRLGHPQYTRGSIGKATYEFGDERGSSPLPSGISYPRVTGGAAQN
jgi:hypothetical protein